MADLFVRNKIPFKYSTLFFGREVDFILEDKIIVECDGTHHNSRYQRMRDSKRDSKFSDSGYIILRFTAAEIRNNRELCIKVVVQLLMQLFPTKYGNENYRRYAS